MGNRTEEIIERLKNRRLVALVIVVSAAVVGAAQLTGAISALVALVVPKAPHSMGMSH